NLVGGVVFGTAGIGGPEGFRVTVNANTRPVTLDQSRAGGHDDPADPDEATAPAGPSAPPPVAPAATTQDRGGDTPPAAANIGGAFKFEDDGPAMTAASNINIQNSGDVAHTGTFAYNLGADGAPINNDVFKAVTGSATVNGVAVQNYTISQTSEDATSAV